MKFLMMSGDTKNAIETAVLRDNGDSGKSTAINQEKPNL